jgi:hypothetical protein
MPQLFHIAPAIVRPLWFVLPIGLLAVVALFTGGVLVASMRGAHTATFELSADGLRLRGDLYGRFIPIDKLQSKAAARVNISVGAFRPTMRTAGTSRPGYRAGWFRLANGEKALLYVTDPTRVVHVPTTAGYSVLLSVSNADQLVEQLHALSRP